MPTAGKYRRQALRQVRKLIARTGRTGLLPAFPRGAPRIFDPLGARTVHRRILGGTVVRGRRRRG